MRLKRVMVPCAVRGLRGTPEAPEYLEVQGWTHKSWNGLAIQPRITGGGQVRGEWDVTHLGTGFKFGRKLKGLSKEDACRLAAEIAPIVDWQRLDSAVALWRTFEHHKLLQVSAVLKRWAAEQCPQCGALGVIEEADPWWLVRCNSCGFAIRVPGGLAGWATREAAVLALGALRAVPEKEET